VFKRGAGYSPLIKKEGKMKSRRVLIQLEVETDQLFKDLKDKENWTWEGIGVWEIEQIQVNVIQDTKCGSKKSYQVT
jgi:hypothetical protein